MPRTTCVSGFRLQEFKIYLIKKLDQEEEEEEAEEEEAEQELYLAVAARKSPESDYPGERIAAV